jgi:hypothetical protein
VIINYLNVKCITILPNETDAILVVDTDTMLSLPIALQRFQSIPGKDCYITQHMGRVQLHQLSLRDPSNLPKSPAALAVEKSLGLLSTGRANHPLTL